jgi:Glycerate kinase
MSRPRVVVATDRIGALDSLAAGTALARGFADHAAVAVVPLAAGGPDLAAALAALIGARAEVERDRWSVRTSELALFGQRDADPDSAAFGRWVAGQLGTAPTVVLDLTGLGALDAGAGLLQEARDALAGRELIGIVGTDELELPATGINSGHAQRAYAAGADIADVLAADARLRTWAESLGDGLATAPGGGAAGGVALAVLGLNGRIAAGQHYCHELASLGQTIAAADLVVTGTTSIGALERGGPIVAQVAAWAGESLRPCLAFTTGDALSRRELRTFGIEAAYSLPADPRADQLTALAARVASGWAGGASADA